MINENLITEEIQSGDRRIFYIDVENMPEDQIQEYLSKIKEEIRQKRISE